MNGSGSQLRLLDTDDVQPSASSPLRITTDINYENAHMVVDLISKHVGDGATRLVLDLCDVDMIDSSGLKALLQAKRLCDSAKVSFKLASISSSVARIISMSGFGPVFGLSPLDVCSKQLLPTTPTELNGWRVYERQSTSDAYVISILRKVVLDATREAGAANDVICDVQIAVGEALTNAYRHGSPVKGKSKIKLKCMACPQALIVEIEDEGLPFDPDAVSIPDPTQLRDHGMGIYLMRQAMDVVEFASGCPGNRVRMIKWLSDK